MIGVRDCSNILSSESMSCLRGDRDVYKRQVFIIPVDSAGITSGLAEIKDAGIPIFNVDTAVIEDDIETVSYTHLR